MQKIFLYNSDRNSKMQGKKNIKNFIAYLFKNEQREIERVNYVFCSDEYLLNLNRSYLKHNTLTDVITFPISKKGEAIVSDIFISVERVKENAKLYNVSYENELLRVVIHGALHLCGYEDKSKISQFEMKSKEDFYLEKFKSFT